MSEKELDSLLARMEGIATAVNAFTSETVQQAAFSALVAAFTGAHHPGHHAAPARPEEHPDGAPSTRDDGEAVAASGGGAGTIKKPAKKRASSGTGGRDFTVAKDLDLRPANKPAFEDFVAEKQPKSNEDKYVVAVYYLQYVLEVPKVTWHQVATIFRLTPSWREPADAVKGLRVTSSRKATVDTSDIDNLKVTPQGRNFVEHDLPPKTKAKA